MVTKPPNPKPRKRHPPPPESAPAPQPPQARWTRKQRYGWDKGGCQGGRK